MKTFFIADTHFWHEKIIEKCRSQFKTITQMNAYLVDQWNRTVGNNDLIYHLGDVSFGNATETKDIISKLNGFKILVRGNHDKKAGAMVRMGFDLVVDSLVINLGGEPVLLAHLPYQDGQIPRHVEKYGELYTPRTDMKLICGHVHQDWLRRGKMLNVGVDRWNMMPVSEEQAIETFES